MVGDLDDVEIVLDDDHRIAPIDKFGQYVEQLADILEMESRRVARGLPRKRKDRKRGGIMQEYVITREDLTVHASVSDSF